MYNEKLNTNPNSIFLITLKPYDVDLPLIFQTMNYVNIFVQIKSGLMTI